LAKKPELPALPSKAPAHNGHKYKPQWGVILVCASEAEQASLYDALNSLRNCKIKVVVA